MRFYFKNMLYFFQSVRRPVYIIPGLGGSVIYNNRTKKEIWPPSLSSVFFPQQFLDNFRLQYEDRHFVPTVESSVGSIGDFKYISVVKNWMKPILRHDYFESFYNFLKEKYSHRQHISSVPYDFRTIGNIDYRRELYRLLKSDVEKTVTETNRKVVFISHSLGGLILHDFLLDQSSSWNHKYIDKIITINCPYEGSVDALNAILNKKINRPFLNKIDYLDTISGILWCIPNPYTSPSRILFQNETTVITNQNVSEIIPEETWEKIEYHFDNSFRKMTMSHTVKSYIIHSNYVETRNCIDNSITNCKTVGDGLIGIDSLTYPKQWNNTEIISIPNKEHSVILNSPVLFAILENLIEK